MNLQEELKVLKERIAELEQQAEQEKEFPRDGEQLFFVSTFGVVLEAMFTGSASDKGLIEIGNIYKTKEQAEFAVEKLKVEAELRKFSRKFIWGGENWILSMGTNKDIFLVYEDDEMNQGAFYFEDEYKALEAIDAVGKERIKKYLFGVEG